MSLTSKEAAETLSDAEAAARRSAQIYSYRKASPHLILWGAVWVIGYAGTDLFPAYDNWIWGPLIVVGCAAGLWIGQRTHRTGGPRGWRMLVLAAIALLFVFSTYAIMHPTHGPQFAAFPALLTGAVYMGVGLWFGFRYVAAGVLVIALTLTGFYFLHQHILLWMAFVGGGAMMLTGLWFRQA